jgi:predicted nucleic acid-binding protein
MRLSHYLIDTSAIVRLLSYPKLRERWEDAIGAGAIACCPATELEMRYSARSVEHDESIRRTLNEMFTWTPMSDRCWERAINVQDALVANGTQRSAGVVDLLVAATADQQGLTLLHDDKDFECVARVTGQPLARVNTGST